MLSMNPHTWTFYTQKPKLNPYSNSALKFRFQDSVASKVFSGQVADNSINNGFSKSQQKAIKQKVSWLTYLAVEKEVENPSNGGKFKFKVNFITLTLPAAQRHKDDLIKSECLNQFLTEMRTLWGLQNYIWRAERQVNGSIHFHILTDLFIPWYSIRNVWNRCLAKLGYIRVYQSEHINLSFREYAIKRVQQDSRLKYKLERNRSQVIQELKRAYEHGIKTNWSDPNSIDIHSLKKVKNVAAYIAKYVSKTTKTPDDAKYCNLDEKPINGRQWFCSQSLSKLKNIVVDVDSLVNKFVDRVHRIYAPKVLNPDYVTILLIDLNNPKYANDSEINTLFRGWAETLGYSPHT